MGWLNFITTAKGESGALFRKKIASFEMQFIWNICLTFFPFYKRKAQCSSQILHDPLLLLR